MPEKISKWFAGVSGTVTKEALKRSIIPAGGAIVLGTSWVESVYWPRVLACFLAMSFVPILFFALIRNLVAKRSNYVNAVLLFTLTFVDLICGLVAVRWTLAGWLSTLIVFLFTVGGLFYSVWLMTFALKLESD